MSPACPAREHSHAAAGINLYTNRPAVWNLSPGHRDAIIRGYNDQLPLEQDGQPSRWCRFAAPATDAATESTGRHRHDRSQRYRRLTMLIQVSRPRTAESDNLRQTMAFESGRVAADIRSTPPAPVVSLAGSIVGMALRPSNIPSSVLAHLSGSRTSTRRRPQTRAVARVRKTLRKTAARP